MRSLPLVQLLGAPTRQPFDLAAADETTTYADVAGPIGLAEIARYAHAVGPAKEHLVPRRRGRSLAPTRSTACSLATPTRSGGARPLVI